MVCVLLTQQPHGIIGPGYVPPTSPQPYAGTRTDEFIPRPSLTMASLHMSLFGKNLVQIYLGPVTNTEMNGVD